MLGMVRGVRTDLIAAQSPSVGAMSTPVPPPANPRSTVSIDELRRNTSEIIARAAAGESFEVLSDGVPTGVVIQSEVGNRSSSVTGEALAQLSRRIASDDTGWADQRRAEQLEDDDRMIDPFAAGTAGDARKA